MIRAAARSRRSRPRARARAPGRRSRARRAALCSRACSTTSRPRCRRLRRRRRASGTPPTPRGERFVGYAADSCRSPARSTWRPSPEPAVSVQASASSAQGRRVTRLLAHRLARSHFHAVASMAWGKADDLVPARALAGRDDPADDETRPRLYEKDYYAGGSLHISTAPRPILSARYSSRCWPQDSCGSRGE